MVVARQPEASESVPEHLLVPFDGNCWWCKARPADSREHKFKRTDLARIQAGDELVWASAGTIKAIRSIERSAIVKFDKTLCAECNNSRSQPFDYAYDTFSRYISSVERQLRHRAGLDFHKIYGARWPESQNLLARYYAKHFGCRLVRDGFAVPETLVAFLDGAAELKDATLTLVINGEHYRNRASKTSLSISPLLGRMDVDRTRTTSITAATYIGYTGVRYHWQEPARWTDTPDSFFGHPHPVLNKFRDGEAVLTGSRISTLRRLVATVGARRA